MGMNPTDIARAFGEGLARGLMAAQPVPEPGSDSPGKSPSGRRRRGNATGSRQLPLGFNSSLGVPSEGVPPVPEYDTTGEVAPILTQAQVEQMERVLRGETGAEPGYVPEEADRMAHMT